MNFDYLQDINGIQTLYKYCHDAEQYQLVAPDKSAQAARNALETWVKMVYLVNGWEIPEKANLLELTTDYFFTTYVADEAMMKRIHYIRKVGNLGAHGQSVSKKESFFSLLNLYETIGAYLVSVGLVSEYPAFDKSLIPTTVVLSVVPTGGKDIISTDALHTMATAEKKPMVVKPSKDTPSEAETRRLFIDMMLREAGWEVLDKEGAIVPGKACIEIQVEGMPSDSGIGFADYVLYADNGQPLAVVEAKKTTVSPEVGHHQAELYADCLEKKHGIRPVIYYTNGFQSWVIDGLGYPARQMYNFHTANDLELLIQKRGRKNITDLRVDKNIAGRDYQIQAIHNICERLNKKMRRGLLVMATGTGKTRVSIALVELLMRNNWVKNVLFLADRTALVSQAAKNYTKLLPSATTCILSEDEHPDMQARIMFSTYQTMIHYIDAEEKQFSVGRFDLIIIDESHRSVYGRYESIFDYFDCLLVGLTATPREDLDHDTYSLLDTDSEEVFAYEIGDAIREGNLVGWQPIQRKSLIMSDGIKYADLSKQEREQLEEVWKYEAAKMALDLRYDQPVPTRDFEGSEIFKYLFNEDTIDKVLEDLMENGLRVNDGDLIGKSIIFAYNHKHAEMIVERFNKLYPQYGPDFCCLIDNYVKYGQDLINNFTSPSGEAKKKIQIAVSVDMLDTGIDQPEVLNLVFFKQVRSKVKFWQMIGRGTRLCPNIFGPGEDKQEFYIFDYCGNFAFFGENAEGSVAKRSASLTERLFAIRLRIAVILQDLKYQEDAYSKKMHDDLKQLLREQICQLEETRTAVRKHWEIVYTFKQEKAWEYVSDVQKEGLISDVAPLLPSTPGDELARKWDLLCLQDELSMIDETVNASTPENKMQRIAEALEKKSTIPQVHAKLPLIQQLLTPVFWESKTMASLENVRIELRDLIHFIGNENGKTFTIDIEDNIYDMGAVPTLTMEISYRQKVMSYLHDHLEDDTVLQKIMHLDQLTETDIRALEEIFWKDLGSKTDYEKSYLKQDRYKLYGGNIAAFIRSVIGIDRAVAVDKFIELIQGGALTALQEEYLKKILDYVSRNGDIEPQVMADEPFSQMDWLETFGEHTIDVRRYIDTLHGIITA